MADSHHKPRGKSRATTNPTSAVRYRFIPIGHEPGEGGSAVGRGPVTTTLTEFHAFGHEAMSPLEAILCLPRSDDEGQHPREFHTLLIDNRNMEPQARIDSVVFYGERNQFRDDGLYVVGNMDGEPMSLYLVQFLVMGGVLLILTNPRSVMPVSRDDLNRVGFWPVLGVATPHSGEFSGFLRERFGRPW